MKRIVMFLMSTITIVGAAVRLSHLHLVDGCGQRNRVRLHRPSRIGNQLINRRDLDTQRNFHHFDGISSVRDTNQHTGGPPPARDR